jgi:hypothetical protein
MTIHELYQNENKLHSTRRQFPLCTRLTRLIGFLSASSLNEQSVSRHAALLWPGFLSASSLNEQSVSRHASLLWTHYPDSEPLAIFALIP